MLRAFYQAGANVVVIFLPQVIFVFLLYWVWYYTLIKLKQKNNKNYLRRKINSGEILI